MPREPDHVWRVTDRNGALIIIGSSTTCSRAIGGTYAEFCAAAPGQIRGYTVVEVDRDTFLEERKKIYRKKAIEKRKYAANLPDVNKEQRELDKRLGCDKCIYSGTRNKRSSGCSLYAYYGIRRIKNPDGSCGSRSTQPLKKEGPRNAP